MIGTILGPGAIFLMLIGAVNTATGLDNWHAMIINFIPLFSFVLICFFATSDTQVLVAQIMSSVYALLMTATFIAIAIEIVKDGVDSPSSMFFLALLASFVIAAFLHPQEFACVFHLLLYMLLIPSMYLLLALYSYINLNIVTWGTREAIQKRSKKEILAEKSDKASNPQTNVQTSSKGKKQAKDKSFLGSLLSPLTGGGGKQGEDDHEMDGGISCSFS